MTNAFVNRPRGHAHMRIKGIALLVGAYRKVRELRAGHHLIS